MSNQGGAGGSLGFHMQKLPQVITQTREKIEDIQKGCQEAFAKFVNDSNPQWYAHYGKTFFQDVGTYVDSLNLDIKNTGDSFIKSLNSAGTGWNKVTGNAFTADTTEATLVKGSSEKADNYQEDKGGEVFMTADCESVVTALFGAFATAVKNKIEELKPLFNKGELIGGDQSQGFINVVGQIGTKFESKINEEKTKLSTALADSRQAYVDFAQKVSETTLEEK